MIENKKEIRNLLAIGALLHDIGKVMHRGHRDVNKYLTTIEKEKHYKEQFKYTHAYLTHLFFKEYFIDNPIIQTSSYHHNPEAAPERFRLYAQIYHLADWYSSAERSKKEKIEKENLLRSIFQSIKLPKNEPKKQEEAFSDREYFYDLTPLKIDDKTIFPLTKEDLIKESDETFKYKNLWKDFEKEFNKLKDVYINQEKLTSSEKFLAGLYYLIYKYFWCVPASTWDPERKERHYPDISLFDHLRVCAAFSTSIYTDYNLDILKKTNKPEDKIKLVFLKGDISGIQKFLYGITNTKGVAKRLRGRSIFLALLSDLIARALLEKFEYPFVNILYSGGGHFEVVLGYEDGIEEELTKFSKEIEEILFKEFHGTLGFALGYTEIILSELKDSKVYKNKIMKNIHEMLDKSKKQKFKHLLISHTPDELLNRINQEFKNNKKTYTICRSCEFSIIEEQVDEEKNICKWCENFKEVGEYIPKACYLMFSKENLKKLKGFYIDKIGGVYFLDEKDFLELESYPQIEENCELYILNDTNFLKGLYICDGFKFIAKTVPLKQTNGNKDEVMAFEELVNEAEGDKKLAFARGDVDNLGLIFMQGLGEDYSISRIATLSRTLDLFFTGYLNYLFNNSEELKNKIYVVYAGGDDFFIIGPWNTVLKALKRIREDFKNYTCNNKDMNISCGVFIAHDFYPIRFAGDLAGKEEDIAKKEKPAIRVLGETLKWEEYAKGLDSAENIADNIEKGLIGRSLFYKFYQLLGSFRKPSKNGKTLEVDPRFYPMFYYFLYRNVKDEKLKNDMIEFFTDTKKDYQIRKEALFKAKYVIMKTRK